MIPLLALPAVFGGSGSLRSSGMRVSVSGLVGQPLTLDVEDLARLRTVEVRSNEVAEDGGYRGAFGYRAVSLKTLLSLAKVRKDESDFFKPIDLAVVVRNRRGERRVLSWGEVLYRQEADVVLAYDGRPVMPMKNCTACHTGSEYQKWLAPLERSIGYPKLLFPHDAVADRSLEEVDRIEVVSVPAPVRFDRKKNASSDAFSIREGNRAVVVRDLSRYRPAAADAIQIGEGKGFHGRISLRGASLADIIAQNGFTPDANVLLVVSSVDGYRSVLSYGEVKYGRFGSGVFVADAAGGKKITELGRFHCVMPDDLASDRWVKALARIDIVSIDRRGRIVIVGVGCGDARLITLDAISQIARADSVVCTDDIKERYAHYIAGKPVLFDPLLHLPHYFRKKNPRHTEAESKKLVAALRERNAAQLREAIGAGKRVAFLEYGDPTIYGSWTYWLFESFTSEDIDVVPGVSAFNAANAMIAKNVAVNGSVVITVPNAMIANEALLAAVAKSGDTLAVFIGIKEIEAIVRLFKKHYSESTPVCLVYKAGYSESGRLYRTTLREMAAVAGREKEKFLGLIYIGPAVR